MIFYKQKIIGLETSFCQVFKMASSRSDENVLNNTVLSNVVLINIIYPKMVPGVVCCDRFWRFMLADGVANMLVMAGVAAPNFLFAENLIT